MNTTHNQIRLESFDAVNLLRPGEFPITERLYAASAAQADQAIHEEREGITEEYYADLADPFIPSGLYGPTQILTAVSDAVYDRLSLRADIGRFVHTGDITARNRHALFCYRPSYSWQDTQFSFAPDLAPDLLPYIHGLQRERTRQMMEFDPGPVEEDPVYTRYARISAKLWEIVGEGDIPFVPPPKQPVLENITAANLARNYSKAILGQFWLPGNRAA